MDKDNATTEPLDAVTVKLAEFDQTYTAVMTLLRRIEEKLRTATPEELDRMTQKIKEHLEREKLSGDGSEPTKHGT